MSRYVCTTCDEKFAVIPKDAVKLTPGNMTSTYRFANGHIHNLRRDNSEALHTRWHKTKKSGCEFCFPPPQSQSVEQSELLNEVLDTLEQLPGPIKQVIAEPHVEDDESSLTSMALAFRRINRR
jgi:hypothetical protein